MTVWAFLDESGDPNLDVDKGGSTHFAVAAIVTLERELHERRSAVELVRAAHFQTGPIKSQTVASNLARRITILQALRDTECHVLGLVVDKRRLRRESGLRFRASFMKYLNRFVYERLFRAYPQVRIRADRHGRPEFMESFELYLQRHCEQTDLFTAPPEIEFVESRSEALVQAADFVAGSLRIAYGDTTSEEDARAILSAIRPMSLGIQEWPSAVRTQAVFQEVENDASVDSAVRKAAELSAYAFLREEADSDDELARMQVETLQELLHALRFEDSGYINSDALVERLRERGFPDCTRDVVRRSVIAQLRDNEVLIVSSAKGYALASSLADLETHFRRMEDEVRPILRRVHVMNEQLRRVSVSRIDLLRGEPLRYLREMVEHHQEFESSGPSQLGEGE